MRDHEIPPLTEETQKLVLSECEQNWIGRVANRLPTAVRRQYEQCDLIQEGALGLIRAAATYDGRIPFAGYAIYSVKTRLREVRRRHFQRIRVSIQADPKNLDHAEDAAELNPADHRRADGVLVCPLLVAWCSDEYRAKRRGIHWRHRLVLVLRYVECMTLRDVADYFGITFQRVQQLELLALAQLGTRIDRKKILARHRLQKG